MKFQDPSTEALKLLSEDGAEEDQAPEGEELMPTALVEQNISVILIIGQSNVQAGQEFLPIDTTPVAGINQINGFTSEIIDAVEPLRHPSAALLNDFGFSRRWKNPQQTKHCVKFTSQLLRIKFE